jgi:Fe2+ or Zn2+ uptake regulation protein
MALQATTLLREAGLKITPARIAILDMFSGGCKPINAEYIFDTLRTEGVNLVTIYRTLATYAEKGILRSVNVHADSVHYELADHHHHHLICTTCGDIEEIDMCNDSLNTEAIAHSKRFANIQQHSLEFFGMCNACARTSRA